MASKSLQNRNAIVTGGSRGIGAGIALELARRGANILLTYNASSTQAETHAAQLKQDFGVDAFAVQGRGSDRDAPKQIVEAAVDRWGHIDIIINNAGAGDDALVQELTHELWDKILDCNLRFPVFLVKEAMAHFGSAPRIVNVSSVLARQSCAYTAAYTASKAALEGVTKTMAIELGQKYGATVNCVNPGPVATDMWLRDTDPAVLAEWDAKIKETPAAPRIATPDDIAQIVAFLSEEGSRWSTGSTVNANGGLCFV
ncbi:3-oxoacyl-[acyl-carrier- ] reductase [Lecanosticta acicola]|uniref:3-oxoacyl-[acyl-carrier-protein] reductase n=1 Tax=Lecanosticta acicola TaxID=111012 RepID=A0AAI8YTD0_9PEZI|nr:3-oxoacyl-[acyl-carrier- ] reductase [Lecanosticta acicola]